MQLGVTKGASFGCAEGHKSSSTDNSAYDKESKVISLCRNMGVTPPLSMSAPTQSEKDLSQSLKLYMEQYGVFETKAEINHRY